MQVHSLPFINSSYYNAKYMESLEECHYCYQVQHKVSPKHERYLSKVQVKLGDCLTCMEHNIVLFVELPYFPGAGNCHGAITGTGCTSVSGV